MKTCKECSYCHEYKSLFETIRSYWCSLYQNMLLRINFDNNKPEKCQVEELGINKVHDPTLYWYLRS